MNQDLLISLISTVATGLASSYAGWFFGRRKSNADARAAEIDTEVKASGFYQSLLTDLKGRLDDAIKTIDIQDKRIRELTDRVEELLIELKKFKQLNGKHEA